MSKTIVAPGVYHNAETNRFTYRPWVRGRRTERTLKATTLKEALREFHKLSAPSSTLRIEDICDAYIEAGAPSRSGSGRNERFLTAERSRLKTLLPFFGRMEVDELRQKHCLDYRDWRTKKVREGFSGLRSIDMELGTLSNALSYAVMRGEIDENRIQQRPRFNHSSKVSHCRDHCPRSGDELHKLARELMKQESSKPMGWQMLFEACSGCRTGEALQLRWDATEGKPGHIRDSKYLCIGRLKQGDDDPYEYIAINPALEKVIAGMKLWNSEGWFFSSWKKDGAAIGESALSLALRRIVPKVLPGRRVTSHGMRAFYVTWRRAAGIPVYQIADEIGHRSGPALIYSTYGRKLPPWASKTFSPYPSDIEPAW